MTDKLKNKVAVVTGSGQGIGRAIAKTLAAEGALVVVGTKTTTNGQRCVDEILAEGGQAALVTCDIGVRDQAIALIDRSCELYGGLDILIHNAAYFPFSTFEELSEEDIDRTFDVNLKAAFWLSQAALPFLKASDNGRILVTSSVSGNHANAPGLTHYSASKAGITGFIRNLALDLAAENITVNAVEPGYILTERNLTENAEMTAATVKQIPMLRGGKPEDIANLMLFLASPEASYITGQSIVVDGGLTLGTAPGITN